MRKRLWLAGVLVGLGLAGPAWAQKSPATFFGGASPQNLVYKPIDTSLSVAPAPQPAQQDKFSFRRLFSKVIPGLSPTPSTNGLALPPGNLVTPPGVSGLRPSAPIPARR